MPIFPPHFFHGLGTDMRRIGALVGRRKAALYHQAANGRAFVATLVPLSGAERTAIWIYTTPDGWFERINSELRADDVSQEVSGYIPIMDRALDKLLVHSSIVFRGIHVEDFREFALDYRAGRTVTWDAYSSCSTDDDVAFWGNVLFIITPNAGRKVGNLSALPAENEVIFPRRSRFKVVYAEIDDVAEVATIELIEV